MTASLTIVQQSSSGITAYAAPIISALSVLLAAIAFLRTSRVTEFQLCSRLSEQIDEKWAALHKIKRQGPYRAQLVDILNHYERCATLINDLRIVRGRAIIALEQQILECLERNWSHEFVKETFRDARSSDDTYCELDALMRRSKKYSFD